jgi:DNA-binding response OmpR family regulator
MRLLVAENDSALGIFLQRRLGAERYAVDLTQSEEQMKRLVEQNEYDLAILDLGMAKDRGVGILRQLRLACEGLQILVLTNRNQIAEHGADDFVLKPFSFSELSARVRALIKRGARPVESLLRVEDLVLNRMEHSVTRANRTIDLTPKEYSLLEFLMRNTGQRVTRSQIIQHVWNLSHDTTTNVVDVYVNYLRKKVDAGAERKLIHTVRGVGYQLNGLPAGRNLRA